MRMVVIDGVRWREEDARAAGLSTAPAPSGKAEVPRRTKQRSASKGKASR